MVVRISSWCSNRSICFCVYVVLIGTCEEDAVFPALSVALASSLCEPLVVMLTVIDHVDQFPEEAGVAVARVPEST